MTKDRLAALKAVSYGFIYPKFEFFLIFNILYRLSPMTMMSLWAWKRHVVIWKSFSLIVNKYGKILKKCKRMLKRSRRFIRRFSMHHKPMTVSFFIAWEGFFSKLFSLNFAEVKQQLEDLMAEIKRTANRVRGKLKGNVFCFFYKIFPFFNRFIFQWWNKTLNSSNRRQWWALIFVYVKRNIQCFHKNLLKLWQIITKHKQIIVNDVKLEFSVNLRSVSFS